MESKNIQNINPNNISVCKRMWIPKFQWQLSNFDPHKLELISPLLDNVMKQNTFSVNHNSKYFNVDN
jgi:hypothetical protein